MQRWGGEEGLERFLWWTLGYGDGVTSPLPSWWSSQPVVAAQSGKGQSGIKSRRIQPDPRCHVSPSPKAAFWRTLPRRGEETGRVRRRERGRRKHSFIRYVLYQALYTRLPLVLTTSSWITTLFSTACRVKMEAQRDGWWRLAQDPIAGMEQNWNPSPKQTSFQSACSL